MHFSSYHTCCIFLKSNISIHIHSNDIGQSVLIRNLSGRNGSRLVGTEFCLLDIRGSSGGLYEHGYETPGSVQPGGFHDQLSDCEYCREFCSAELRGRVSKQIASRSKTAVMDVIGFLCVSLGSSTVQFHDSLCSR
jgi:hypothetical protein